MKTSVIWRTVGNRDVVASFLENTLALLHHDGHVEVGLLAAEKGVDSRLVHNQIELTVRVFEFPDVHDLPLHIWSCFVVAIDHLLNTNLRYVHVPNV